MSEHTTICPDRALANAFRGSGRHVLHDELGITERGTYCEQCDRTSVDRDYDVASGWLDRLYDTDDERDRADLIDALWDLAEVTTDEDTRRLLKWEGFDSREAGSSSVAFLAAAALALVPVGLVLWSVSALAGGIAGVA